MPAFFFSRVLSFFFLSLFSEFVAASAWPSLVVRTYNSPVAAHRRHTVPGIRTFAVAELLQQTIST